MLTGGSRLQVADRLHLALVLRVSTVWFIRALPRLGCRPQVMRRLLRALVLRVTWAQLRPTRPRCRVLRRCQRRLLHLQVQLQHRRRQFNRRLILGHCSEHGQVPLGGSNSGMGAGGPSSKRSYREYRRQGCSQAGHAGFTFGRPTAMTLALDHPFRQFNGNKDHLKDFFSGWSACSGARMPMYIRWRGP